MYSLARQIEIMGKRWTEADLRKLRPGAIVELQGHQTAVFKLPEQKNCKTTRAKDAPQLAEMKAWLRILKIAFVTEHIFHATRKWRFDIALPDRMLAIEYEGTVSEKSRHTTLSGYAGDCTKYNEAQKCGWRVLRYTALNYADFMKDITDIFEIKEV